MGLYCLYRPELPKAGLSHPFMGMGQMPMELVKLVAF